MDIRKVLGLAGLGLAVGLVGCGDDDNGVVNPFLELPQTMVDGAPANYGCLGSPTAPATGEERTFTLIIRDFQSGDRVPGICVNFYGDNNVPETDECGGAMTDAEGELEVTNNGGWFAYRLFETATTMGVVQRNVLSAEEGGTQGGNSVAKTTAGLLPGLLGRQRDEGTSVFAGSVYDCDGETVEGAGVGVARGGSMIPEGPGSRDPMYAYFGTSSLPDGNQPYTNTNGLFLAINMPVNTPGEMVQVVACGKPDGTNLEIIGCEETRSFADTVNIVSPFPRRADGPNCPDICND
jgi:hypothetical protein